MNGRNRRADGLQVGVTSLRIWLRAAWLFGRHAAGLSRAMEHTYRHAPGNGCVLG
ncbi:MAG: hypothetical protein KDA71_04495 [Planctomycetales bacterium]|nr:hypothetical protein [Planctomycetales bacterium]